MSLQPKDLLHGGLYRHKETGLYWRFSMDGFRFLIADKKTMHPTEVILGGSYRDFEGIPITPDVLKDWFGTIDAGLDKYNFTGRFMVIYVGNGYFRLGIHQRFGHFKHVHEFQRLYLALTGSELEGGPE